LLARKAELKSKMVTLPWGPWDAHNEAHGGSPKIGPAATTDGWKNKFRMAAHAANAAIAGSRRGTRSLLVVRRFVVCSTAGSNGYWGLEMTTIKCGSKLLDLASTDPNFDTRRSEYRRWYESLILAMVAALAVMGIGVSVFF
jgi:hypothetical protein